jgi:hypothetical protein
MRAILAALFLCVASPTFAFDLLQGPWNVHAQPVVQRQATAKRSSWVPPRNARCGWYLRRKLGHGDAGLNLAQNWLRFPRTAARPGTVVVWTRGGRKGHVAQIVRVTGACRAVVHDNRGTYERDICRRVLGYVRA